MNTSALIIAIAAALPAAGNSWAAPPDATPVKSAAADKAAPPNNAGLYPAYPSYSSQLFAAMDRQAGLLDLARGGASLSYLAGGSALALSQQNALGTVIGFGAGSMSDKFFGLEASGLAPLELHQYGRFNAPYFAMVKDASHAGVSFAMGGGARLRFGALSEGVLPVAEPFGPVIGERTRRFLSSAEFEQKVGNAVGIVTVGVLRENGAMLGSQQGLALALNASPTTIFTSLSAGYALTPRTSLVAMASYGKTEHLGGSDSLIAQVATVRTVAYSVGLATSQIFSKHDRIGLTFAMPAKVRADEMAFSGPAAPVPQSGLLGLGVQPLNFRPTATERDLEMTYSTMFGNDGRAGKLTGAVMYRINPGHDATAKPDVLIGIRYSRGF